MPDNPAHHPDGPDGGVGAGVPAELLGEGVHVSKVTETLWGVRHADGHVESAGTTPSGTIGQFDEDVARYLARVPGRTVVHRTRTRVTTTTPWVEADD